MEDIRETFKKYIRKIAQTGGRQLNYYKVFLHCLRSGKSANLTIINQEYIL